MNSYKINRSSATTSVVAGVLMIGYSALAMQAQAEAEAMERISEGRYMVSSNTLKNSIDVGPNPTSGVNAHEVFVVESAKLLHFASEAFAKKMAIGVESLGAEFSSVIEENFWDLVLR